MIKFLYYTQPGGYPSFEAVKTAKEFTSRKSKLEGNGYTVEQYSGTGADEIIRLRKEGKIK